MKAIMHEITKHEMLMKQKSPRSCDRDNPVRTYIVLLDQCL